MGRLSYLTAWALFSGIVIVSAQPGPITTSNSSNLIFAASTLLTNGLPGLSGPPVTLMVDAVQLNSAQGGTVSLVTSQAWVSRYNAGPNTDDQALAIVADKDGNILVGGYSYSFDSLDDYLSIKYTPDGIPLWTNRYDGPEHWTDKIDSVAVDGSGGGTSGDLQLAILPPSSIPQEGCRFGPILTAPPTPCCFLQEWRPIPAGMYTCSRAITCPVPLSPLNMT